MLADRMTCQVTPTTGLPFFSHSDTTSNTRRVPDSFTEGDFPGALHQRLQQRRHQYLAALSLTGDARSQIDVPGEEVLAFLDRLPRVQPDPHRDRLDTISRRRTSVPTRSS